MSLKFKDIMSSFVYATSIDLFTRNKVLEVLMSYMIIIEYKDESESESEAEIH